MRIGSWWGAREWRLGPCRVTTMRVPAGKFGTYNLRLIVEAGPLHIMTTWRAA